MENKVKTRTPAAIDYANRAIALKWAPENLRSFIEGTFEAAYIAGRIDKGEEAHNTAIDECVEQVKGYNPKYLFQTETIGEACIDELVGRLQTLKK